uniref:Uncharacterized protein n=1 Tax=Riboviria sp. TaxID=2585031 RepID=A0A514D4E8_9VIRU|nr:MAG: hypothetical protein H1Rhizo252419_000001 [Riboviria sp.]
MGVKTVANASKSRNNMRGSEIMIIPTRYPNPGGDVLHARFAFTVELVSNSSGVAGILLIYGSGTNAAGYGFLNGSCQGFSSLRSAYTKFLVTRLHLKSQLVSNLTAGGYLAINYEPSSSTLANPPTSILDVSNAVHTANATPGIAAILDLRPTDYYNDWRYTLAGSDANSNILSQMGVTQVYGTGPVSSTIGVLEVELDIAFAGYSKLGP